MLISDIQRRLPSHNIRLSTRHPPRLLIYLPKQIQASKNRYPNIRRNKIIDLEFLRRARERPEAIEDRNHSEEHEGEPSCVGLERGTEFKGGAIDVLGAEGGVESYVGYADGHPGEEDGDGG